MKNTRIKTVLLKYSISRHQKEFVIAQLSGLEQGQQTILDNEDDDMGNPPTKNNNEDNDKKTDPPFQNDRSHRSDRSGLQGEHVNSDVQSEDEGGNGNIWTKDLPNNGGLKGLYGQNSVLGDQRVQGTAPNVAYSHLEEVKTLSSLTNAEIQNEDFISGVFTKVFFSNNQITEYIVYN